ncbi:MAG: hypothetical protein J3Q66DRAFT_407801 [Benniella sp.]|nr:MAG: hypothetical protein J3Q66DRAFT_407801 [Benniella sp.]
MEEREGSGFTAYPVTSTTKCFFNATESENIMVIALTSTRFRAPTGLINDLYPAEFVRTNFTNEADDLLLAMQESVKIKRQLIHWLVGSPYTSSVYTILRKRLASYTNTSIPKLMRFQFQLLMFEDVTLLPDEIELSPEATTEEGTLLPDQARTSSSVISYQ